jgi:trk system potassium uptake protein
MKKNKSKYIRKSKIRFKDIFKLNDEFTQPLEEEMENQKAKNNKNGIFLILGYLGIFLIVAGIIILAPILCMIFYRYEFNRILAFLLPGVISIGIGIGLSLLLKNREQTKLGKYQDFVLLILIWLFSCLFCAIPFALPDYIGSFRMGGLGLNYFQALYETVSGFATCGLSALKGSISPSNLLNGDGHCFLFYRAFIQFTGGVGFVLVLTCILNDNHGISLYYSEGHTDRLLPNLYKSAKLIFGIYLALTVVGSLALWLSGMNEWTKINRPLGCENDPEYASYFEALCTTMSSVSSAGFSTRDMSIYAYNNLAIEIVVEILMVLSATNFFVLFLLFTCKFKRAFKDLDMRTTIYAALLFIPIMIIITSIVPSLTNSKLPFRDSLRYDIFFYISSVTTTGFVNTPSLRESFSAPIIFLITFVMCLGGQQGSTAGGIKMYRCGIIAKSIYWSLKEKYSAQNVIYPHYVYKYGRDQIITQKDITDSCTYGILYMLLFFVLSLLFAMSTNGQYDFLFVMFETSTALSNAGISSGIEYMNNTFLVILITFAMFVGRLEIFTFIYAGKKIAIDTKVLSKNIIYKIKNKHQKSN